jgi:hypothetical protein
MEKAHKALLQRLGAVLGDGTNELTTGFLDKLYGIVRDHRAECRRKGIDFPAMVALVVPRLGIVDFKRADLDIASVRQSIVNFVRMNPEATMLEVVEAFRRAYPDLKPGDILEKQDDAVQIDQRAKERSDRIGAEALRIVKEQDEGL